MVPSNYLRITSVPAVELLTAQFDFPGSEDRELCLLEGDVISDLATDICEGWSSGTNERTGCSGLFPSSYASLTKVPSSSTYYDGIQQDESMELELVEGACVPPALRPEPLSSRQLENLGSVCEELEAYLEDEEDDIDTMVLDAVGVSKDPDLKNGLASVQVGRRFKFLAEQVLQEPLKKITPP